MISLAAGLVGIHPRSYGAHRWLPSIGRPGRIFVGPDGTTLRLLEDGALELVQAGGMPRAGAASVPENAGRPRRYP